MVDNTHRKQKNRCKWKESIKKYKKEDVGVYLASFSSSIGLKPGHALANFALLSSGLG